MSNQIIVQVIKKRISELQREIQVLSTEESKLFFTGNPVDYMISHSKVKDLKANLEELQKQLIYIEGQQAV